MISRKKSRSAVLVIGSANMDLVFSAERFPRPGETLFASGFGMFPGGKGANQAVACARLGTQTLFLAKTGRDLFRGKLLASLKQSGVRLTHVISDPVAPTGIALIGVDAKGENQIMVVSGSNMRLLPADIRKRREIFSKARVVLLQLEIPLATVVCAAGLAARSGSLVVLNPAPARRLPRSLLRSVDYITPNETEAGVLSGMPVHSVKSATHAADRLIRMGVGNVIVTMGTRGALLVTPGSARLFPSPGVRAVDTTGAGDAFNGALAGALSSGMSIDGAITRACAVGAFSVTRPGAQASMPTAPELREFLNRRQARKA
jgi:ribokinase